MSGKKPPVNKFTTIRRMVRQNGHVPVTLEAGRYVDFGHSSPEDCLARLHQQHVVAERLKKDGDGSSS